jgi:hypothetical protein
MSTPSATVVTSDGKSAAQVHDMKGGAIALSPLPLSGGRRRRGSLKMTKRMKKMLKTLKKLKGGEMEEAVEAADEGVEAPVEGARRRRRGSRKSRRGSKKGRAGLFY